MQPNKFITTLSLQPLEGTDVALSNTTHTLKSIRQDRLVVVSQGLVKMAFSARTGT